MSTSCWLYTILFAMGGLAMAGTHVVDIGGGADAFYIGGQWYGQEGPYPQYGPIWHKRCRWAAQGAEVWVPVFPGVTNTLEMRAAVADVEGQRVRLYLDGELAALQACPT